jgi:hypothetical protein
MSAEMKLCRQYGRMVKPRRQNTKYFYGVPLFLFAAVVNAVVLPLTMKDKPGVES